MKNLFKSISFVLVFVSLFAVVQMTTAQKVSGYEISQDRIVLTQEFPRFSSGSGVFCDMTKIQSVEFQTKRGGFIRLATHMGNNECFSLKIYRVPEGMSIDQAMPYINNLPLEAELTGAKGNDLEWVRAGKYIYVLRSKVQYLYEWQVEEHLELREEVQVLMTGKTSGAWLLLVYDQKENKILGGKNGQTS